MASTKLKYTMFGLASAIFETTGMSPHLVRKANRFFQNLPGVFSIRLLILRANHALAHDRVRLQIVVAFRSLPAGKTRLGADEFLQHVRNGLMEVSKGIRECSGMKLRTVRLVEAGDLTHALDLYGKLIDREKQSEQGPRQKTATEERGPNRSRVVKLPPRAKSQREPPR